MRHTTLPHRAFVLAAAICIAVSGARAQERPGIALELPNATRLTAEGPLVRAEGVLSDDRMRELLASGFPARLHYRVELWSSERWFDNLHRTAEWNVLVRWRGVDQMYEVTMYVGDRVLPLGAFRNVEDAEAAVERPLRVPIAAPASNRQYYYVASLEVETLSVSDLDEVGRWLRGEAEPTLRGQRNPGTALSRTIKAITSRLLGGERRGYGARTDEFRPGR
jgi:hypothetical protein